MTIASAQQRFEIVAVAQPESTEGSETYSLGVRSAADGAGFMIGSPGPEHLPVKELYFTAGNKEFKLDLDSGLLTIADKSNLRVTIFSVDVSALQGQVIEHNKEFSIVLCDKNKTKKSLPIGRWIATTEETFTRDALPDYIEHVDGLALSISGTTQEAKRIGMLRFDTASGESPQLATEQKTQVVDIRESQQTSEIAQNIPEQIEDENQYPEGVLADDGSLAVILPDPASGVRYWAREWTKDLSEEDELTLLRLRSLGHRVVILEMTNGKSAAIALNDPKGLPVLSISKKPGKPPVERYLTEDTWGERFGPNKSLHFRVESDLNGDQAPESGGDLSTPTIARVTATQTIIRGEKLDPRIKISDALATHRRLGADRDPEYDRSLVRTGFGS